MASTGLQNLPTELIAYIVAYLPDQDALTIRLTSRYLERASFSYYGKHFFRKKGFMITTPSLEVLRSIAIHRDLSQYVEHIWFNPDCFLFAPPDCQPEEIYDDGDEYDDEGNGVRFHVESLSRIDRARWEAYSRVLEDHRKLMESDNLERQLTQALRTLPNLQAIGMRRSEDHRPWGWKTLKDAVGQDPRILGPIPSGPLWSLSGPTKLFLAIINAVACTPVTLRRLYTDAIEIDNIRPDLLPQATLAQVCGSLLYLEINCSKAWLNARNKAEDYITLRDVDSYGQNLVRLLTATPQLQELGLQIFPDRKQRYMVAPSAQDPESWRRSYPYKCLELLAAAAPLRNLSRVKLEKLTTTPTTLLSFLQPQPQPSISSTLSSLKIRDIRLLSSDDAPRPWAPVFAALASTCPALAYVLFYHLMYEAGGVSFTQHAPPPAPAAGDELFTQYDHLAFEVRGRAVVQAGLRRVVDEHWYHRPVFSYTMDEELWHTDTSDEEW